MNHIRITAITIKRVLLAVAQSRSLHVVHDAYLCKSCFRNAIYLHFNPFPGVSNSTEPIEKVVRPEEPEEKRASEKEPCRLLITLNAYNHNET